MSELRASMRASPRLLCGLALLGIVGLAALAGALMTSDPLRSSAALLAGPSGAHPLGTDELGRDVLARVLEGAGTSLRVAFASVLLATLVATTLGLLSGYAGGLVDDLLLKLVEVFQVIPGFLLALVAAAIFGPSLTLIVVVLVIIFLPRSFRIARGEAIALREREFVTAARAAGARGPRILARHILPGALPVVVVNASFQGGTAVLIEAGLSFLGLGERDAVSLGAMLSDAQDYLGTAWWMSVFPGVVMTAAILGMNLVGDGINELRDVRGGGSRGARRPRVVAAAESDLALAEPSGRSRGR